MPLSKHFPGRRCCPCPIVHQYPMPGAFKKTVHTFDTVIVPLGVQLRRTDEQFIHAKRIATEIAHEVVWVDHVSFRFRHLLGLAALADIRNHSLVEEPEERLVEIDDTY